MKRRRPEKPARREARPAPFHNPFGDLRKRIATQGPAKQAPSGARGAPNGHGRQSVAPGATPSKGRGSPTSDPRSARERNGKPRAPGVAGDAASAEDDASSFLRAMADVRRLERDARIDAPAPAVGAPVRAAVDEEAEALAALSDLVSGAGGFDISDSTEYVEGSVVGLDARILRRLRHGEFPYSETLDLHGLSASAARIAVEAFVTRAFRAGRRCILIVHGRGRNSRDQVPVLKERLKSWLAHGKVGRAVLAFTSARPADGGTGALYVLLRRQRGTKEPMDVYEGAKREW